MNNPKLGKGPWDRKRCWRDLFDYTKSRVGSYSRSRICSSETAHLNCNVGESQEDFDG